MKTNATIFSVAILMLLNINIAHAETINAHKTALQVAASTCSACHGEQGRSISPIFPNLAGQTATYLADQLKSFKSHTRADPDAVAYMWGIAGQLNDDLIQTLADYYSAQRPVTKSVADLAVVSRGEQIYINGVIADGVPPCATCHGPHGAGTDIFPRLAGQHAQYTLKQLNVIKNNLRNSAVMRNAILGLKENDMTAVAQYLQSMGM